MANFAVDALVNIVSGALLCVNIMPNAVSHVFHKSCPTFMENNCYMKNFMKIEPFAGCCYHKIFTSVCYLNSI